MKTKRERELEAALKKLTETCAAYDGAMDKIMKLPSTFERGKKIADLLNKLQIANQMAMYFTLGYSFGKIKKLYNGKLNMGGK
jgi:uncharacterized protein YigA (DUF484 family)